MITQSTPFDKQEAILSAALRLFVEYGFHGTPTSKIASEAGVAHGTLFHYFKTKDELVITLYNSINANFRAYLSENATPATSIKDRFKNLFYYSVQWSLQYKNEFYFTQQFHFSPHFKQLGTEAEEMGQQSYLHRALYTEALQTNIFKPLPIELITSLCMSQLVGTYEYLINTNFPDDKQDEVIDKIIELTWAMFTQPEAI
ncbi:TetR family transcriptional regulator [Spirosoma sp. HMF4905]|uniref:TetR family transcriptional regulator n=1 Tax=Spirosoma arboris TaxID=2682092 RepID=A0A7K1SL49_9BACT|nr:TetR/AcrR family transcriptional regulator [Spirosoma arboris]MVM34542.1 TetR family transcriptional regulator [Spirosoma arboris]